MKNTWKTVNKLLGNFHSREEMRALETTEGRLSDSQHIVKFLCGYLQMKEKYFAIKRGLIYVHL